MRAMLDRNVGNTALALGDAAHQAREDALDARDAQLLADGRELLAAFPRAATPAMLKRLLDLGDVPNPSTADLLQFVLDEFRAGSLGARRLMQRFWCTAADWPELLPEPPIKLPAERLRVTGAALDLAVEQAR